MESSFQFGFEGNIWHLNPRNFTEDEFGRALAELPEIPDCAYIAIPSEHTIRVVKALTKIGVGGCVCYASGFAEMGNEGVELQNKLVEAAGDMALLGPNCFGLIDYRAGLYFWIGEIPAKFKGKGIAIVSQSGAIAEFLAMQQRESPIVSIVSVGNQASLSIEKIVEVTLQDSDVNSIGLVIEGIIDVGCFARVARKALEKGIPITVLKIANSRTGREIAKRHTGNLISPLDLYTAYFNDLGILQATSVEQFLETTKLVSMSGRLKSNRVASVTVSGGQAAMIADKADEFGIEYPLLTKHQVKRLHSLLPKYANITNPLDITSDVMSNKQTVEYVCDILANGNIDVITMSVDAHKKVDAPFSADVLGMLEALANVVNKSNVVGIVNSELQETMPDFIQKRAIELGLIPIQGLKSMLSAISTASSLSPPGRFRARQTLPANETRSRNTQVSTEIYLDEFKSKTLVKRFGVPIPKGFKNSGAGLVQAAHEIGFPVVLKLLSSETLHKSENFRVITDIRDEASLVNAKSEIEHHNPTGNIFLIEKMVPDVVGELLISISFDTKFGYYLTLGSGGVFAEVLSDTVTLILPVTRQSLADSLSNLKCFPILSGYRNRLEGDIQSAISTIECLITFINENLPGRYEVEINPLLVLPRGKGVIAGDAIVKKTILT